MSCEPVFGYGRTPARCRYVGSGYERALAEGPDGAPTLRLTTSLRLAWRDGVPMRSVISRREKPRSWRSPGGTRSPQHDVWGSLLDSAYLHTKSRDHLPEHAWTLL